jgi:hypothetical protein
MHFEAMFRQYLFISSLHIVNKMSINLPFSSKCIHEVDSIFRMTTFVKYTGTAGCALTISGGSRNFVWGPSRLFPPSFLHSLFLPSHPFSLYNPHPFLSFPIPYHSPPPHLCPLSHPFPSLCYLPL